MAMPDLQWYPRNHNLIKNVEDIVVFLTRKVFNSDNLAIASCKKEMCKSLSQKTANAN